MNFKTKKDPLGGVLPNGSIATRKPNPQIVKYSIPEATNRGANGLIGVEPVDLAIESVQVA